jgi:bisphosphoglycerate-independent phosphoglycerate mutase (AlkP superfamily)
LCFKTCNFVLAYDGALVITADHGNVEEMINSHSGQVETEHSSNPVPFIVISKDFTGRGEYYHLEFWLTLLYYIKYTWTICPLPNVRKNLLEELK